MFFYNNKNKGIIAVMMSFMSSLACSGQQYDGPYREQEATFITPSTPLYSFVATVSAGVAWAQNGTNQTFNLTPDIKKAYIVNNGTNTLATGELFLGVQTILDSAYRRSGPFYELQGQLGLAFAGTDSASIAGTILDNADPFADNYTYSYNIRHTHVAVKGNLLLNMGTVVIPWIGGSAGVGFNNASGFNSVPLIEEALPTPAFAANNVSSFTYTLGIGVQVPLTRSWQLGAGYQFADWGKSQLGRAAEQTLNAGLTQDHLYTNSLLLNISFLS